MVNSLVLTKAQNAVTAHDWSTAARLYKELLRKDESNITFLKELGNIYVKMNEDEKAIPYYEQIITFHPEATEAMVSLGAIYRRLKRYEESISILQRALDEGHDRAMVNYTLGFTYKDMKNYEDAIDAFESVISMNPNDVLAYNHLASIYFEEKEYQKSIATFTRGLQVDPNHPILNYNLARCYEAAKNYPEAVRCYENALKTRPGWADAIRDFSELLIKCQFTKQAQILVEQSIKLNPNDVDLLCILGRIYLSQFDYDNATKTFKKANNLRNNDVLILMGLSEALEKNDKISQSLDTAIEAMDISPENKDVRKRYVHTLLSSQRYAKALEVLKALDEETDGRDLQVMDLYGQYFICRGDDEAANTYYEKIKKVNHHYKDYMLNASDRYIQTGNLQKAADYANEFITSRSQLPDGYNRLGTIYRSQGELKTARNEFEKGITLRKPNIFAKKEIAKIDALLEQQEGIAPPKEEIVEQPVEQVQDDFATDAENENALLSQGEESILDYNQFENAIATMQEEEEDFWDSMEDEEKNPLVDEESDPGEILSMMDPDDLKALEKDEEEEPKKDPFNFDEEFSEDDDDKSEPLKAENVPPKPENPPVTEAQPQVTLEPEEKMPPDPAPIPESQEVPLEDEITEDDGFNIGDFADTDTTEEQEPEFEMQENAIPVVQKEEFSADPEQMNEISQKMLDTVDSALTTASMAQQMAQDILDSQKQMEEDLKEQNEKLIQETVEKAIEDKLSEIGIPEDDFELDLGEEETESSQDEIQLDDELPEDDIPLKEENTIQEPFDENGIPTSDDVYTDKEIYEDNELSDDMELPFESTEENFSVVEDYIAENPDFQDLDFEEQKVEDPSTMLEKISKILNDDEIAAEYSNEIELFKTLRMLSNFLPESEKYSFNSCRMRLKIEYIIAKMSGKPGLLETAESLIKSGVLGEEYLAKLEFDSEENEVTNEMIRQVFLTMKDLSQNLEDSEISKAICITADCILEQIELANQKSAIF